jgi:hypothetical protein
MREWEMGLDTAVYIVLVLSVGIFWQNHRLEKQLRNVYRRLGMMMSPAMQEAEINEFVAEREERRKIRKRVMVLIAIVAAVTVGWYFLTRLGV